MNEPNLNDWRPIATIWGRITPLTGRELVWAQEVVAEANHKVEIRYRPGMNAKQRFLYKDPHTGAQRQLNILLVLNVEERNREMICLCREAV